MISVIIPLYNKEAYIRKALESVLSQTYQDFEIVVVNDGSTDNSLDKVLMVKDERIRIISQNNAGVSATRNRGIEEAKYEYVTFLDADDIWDKDFLKNIYHLIISYPECSVYSTCYNKFCDGKYFSIVLNGMSIKDEGVFKDYFEVASHSDPPICSITVAMKKRVIQTVGGFPVGVVSGEDLLTWARLAARYKVAYTTKVLATFVLPDSDVSYKPKRKFVKEDYVGEQLGLLYKEFPKAKGLNQYVAFWHKIRCHVALGWGEHKYAAKEALMAISCNPANIKLYIMLACAILPHWLVVKIFN